MGRKKFNRSLEILKSEPCGIVVYIRKSMSDLPRPISNMREYGIGAQILKALGVHDLDLLSSNVRSSYDGLESFGLNVKNVRLIEGEASELTP